MDSVEQAGSPCLQWWPRAEQPHEIRTAKWVKALRHLESQGGDGNLLSHRWQQPTKTPEQKIQ